jgi:serine/threonine protein phosphatase 1
MFRKWFGTEPEIAPRISRAPEGVRLYAIGDIHGRVDLLRALHALIAEHGRDFQGLRKIIYLGDYIDRGIDSRGVIEFLCTEPLEGFEPVFLRGNHDDWLLHFLQDSSHGAGWLCNGGDATLYSYGVHTEDEATPRGSDTLEGRLRRAQSELKAALPDHHLHFLNDLVLHHVEGDYFFVHAGVRPGRALDEQSADDLIWIREEFLGSKADFGKVIVHGHSISYEPELLANRIGVDTGACFSGALTAVVLEGESRTLLQSGSGTESLLNFDE